MGMTPNAAVQKHPNRRLSSQRALGPSLKPRKKCKEASRGHLRLDASNVVPGTWTGLVPVAFDRQTLRLIGPIPRSHMKSPSPQSSLSLKCRFNYGSNYRCSPCLFEA